MLRQLLNGLAIGSVYALFALGYTLVFSILRVINFAHAAVFTVGAYLTYLLLGETTSFSGLLANSALPFRLPFWLAALAGAVGAGLLAVVIERVAFRPLRRRGSDPLLTLVSSLGVAIAVINLVQYLFGAENYQYPGDTLGGLPRSVAVGDIRIQSNRIIIFVVAMALVAVLTAFVNRTRTGKALRAVAEDTTTARLLGIEVERLIVLTFFVSGFLGAVAGTLIALPFGISGPYFGVAYGLKGLAVIVLGGLGDIPGAVVGGLVIGVVESFVPAGQIGYKDAVAFAVLLLVLLARPQGILGRGQVEKV